MLMGALSFFLCFFFNYFSLEYSCFQSSQVVLVVKNPVTNVRDIRDECSIPWSGRSPGGGHGNALSITPGESHGQRILAGYSPWSRKESDMTEQLTLHFTHRFIMRLKWDKFWDGPGK